MKNSENITPKTNIVEKVVNVEVPASEKEEVNIVENTKSDAIDTPVTTVETETEAVAKEEQLKAIISDEESEEQEETIFDKLPPKIVFLKPAFFDEDTYEYTLGSEKEFQVIFIILDDSAIKKGLVNNKEERLRELQASDYEILQDLGYMAPNGKWIAAKIPIENIVNNKVAIEVYDEYDNKQYVEISIQ